MSKPTEPSNPTETSNRSEPELTAGSSTPKPEPATPIPTPTPKTGPAPKTEPTPPKEQTKPSEIIRNTPVSAVGVVNCGGCGKNIFETDSRIELNGAIRSIRIDGKDKLISTIANNGAFCSVECLGVVLTRK